MIALTAVLQGEKNAPDWKTGKVLDARLARSSVVVGSTSSSTGTATSSTSLDFLNIRENQVIILSDEFAYVVEDTRASGGKGLIAITAHAVANRKHGCRYIVGDDVKFWQEKALLHVIDADGKECKVDILRQERLKR